MASLFIWEISLILSQFLLLLVSADEEKCPSSFDCADLGQISFPFTIAQYPRCGIVAIHGCDHKNLYSRKTIQVNNSNTPSRQLFVENVDHNTITVSDDDQQKRIKHKACRTFEKKFTLPPASPLASYYIKYNITMFKCNHSHRVNLPEFFHTYAKCPLWNIYYGFPNTEKPLGFKWPTSLTPCSTVQVAVKGQPSSDDDPFDFLSADMVIEVQLSKDCRKCFYHRKGHCQLDTEGKFYCAAAQAENKRSLAMKLGLGIGLPAIILTGLLIIWRCKSRSVPDFNPNPYTEGCSVYFGVPVFSYKDLEVATKKFDRSRELGEGGFGIVYYGKLKDGREVAVKRLYQHNYKRAQQFANEIKILTRLRHRNLVSLYGCTHGRELLLVYEYISNGTVASHLRCESTSSGFLPWSIRMKVALETATALAYLHASDIIHRDVKTNNILLDSSFCVKVADFGLSRLFPNDVTHVSTAPQGTPGYVDPEYHQCYQLTNKSDVYSFGVVLAELISSMPAVDMTRHKDEINLANLAIRKIQKSAIGELVDPSLGFELDSDVRRKVVSMAELAFRCLQRDKELRPSMDEVLKVLRRIENGKDEPGHLEKVIVWEGMSHSDIHPLSAPSLDHDEMKFFRNMNLTPSPNAVTEKWDSKFTTPNVSGQSASQI